MHAVDPVQRLRLVERRLESDSDRRFHDEMISIFIGLRDLHTNYILPEPFAGKIAFLPFRIEAFWEGDARRYLVTGVTPDLKAPPFGLGVEVTHWNGIPIDRAVSLNGERNGGSNVEARHERGLSSMTQDRWACSQRLTRNGWTSPSWRTAPFTRCGSTGRCSSPRRPRRRPPLPRTPTRSATPWASMPSQKRSGALKRLSLRPTPSSSSRQSQQRACPRTSWTRSARCRRPAVPARPRAARRSRLPPDPDVRGRKQHRGLPQRGGTDPRAAPPDRADHRRTRQRRRHHRGRRADAAAAAHGRSSPSTCTSSTRR